MDSIRGKIFYRRDYNKYKEIKQWSDISKWRTSLLGVTFSDYVKVLSIQGKPDFSIYQQTTNQFS